MPNIKAWKEMKGSLSMVELPKFSAHLIQFLDSQTVLLFIELTKIPDFGSQKLSYTISKSHIL